MGVHEVFEVLYSPVKAFKKIIEKPDSKGALLILAIVLAFTAVTQYITASKLFLENQTPDKDTWTESPLLWTSNGMLVNDTDRVVGNYSTKGFISDSTTILMRITDIGRFNTSGDEGFKGLSFRIKWIHQNGTPPSSDATLRLFSSKESHYFESNLLDNISNSSNEWYNVTFPISIGPESEGWISFGSPDWENITGLEFRLDWLDSDAANLTMKIDDLYFGNFVSLLAAGFFDQWLIQSLMKTATDFIVRWILFAVFLWLIIKSFRGETGPWRFLFIIIGYTFSIRIVSVATELILISALPPLDFPLKAWNPVKGEGEVALELTSRIYENTWYNTLTGKVLLGIEIFLFGGLHSLPFGYQIIGTIVALTFAFHAWTIALSAVAIRSLRGFTWKKAMVISSISYVLYLFLRPFIPV